MKNIEITLWCNLGGGDGDNYEDTFEVTDQEYETIISLIKEYKAQVPQDEWAGEEFTEDWLEEKANDLYHKIFKETKQQQVESMKENGLDEDEIEYADYGFYITLDFIKSI